MLHLSDDGALQDSMSCADFFTTENQERLSELKNQIKSEVIEEPAEQIQQNQESDSDLEKKKGIISDEEQEDRNTVDYRAILDYFNFCSDKLGGRFSVLVVVGLHILINIATSSMSFYLAFSLSNLGNNGAKETRSEQKSLAGALTFIVIICLVTTIAGKYLSCLIFMSINRNMHTKIVTSLINTKMQFFDENTSGRIINRLSKDISVTDMIVFNFLEMLDYIIKCLFSVTFIVYSSPMTLVIVCMQLWYFKILRRKVIMITRECFGLVISTNGPIISLIQDCINGQVAMRSFECNQFFLREFWRHTDKATEAYVTSNGVNRYSAFRIDMQAFYIATIFAGISLFTELPKTQSELAVKAIGFQMAVEVARHFNTAIRWTFKMEMDLVAV